ncbi:MAG: hypothetical protein ACTJHC_02715 [Vagococcus sp.]
MKNNELKNGGVTITDSYLRDRADRTDRIEKQITLIMRHIENVEYQRVKGDKFAVESFIQCGDLGLINDNLTYIKEELRSISNDICPDFD